MNYAYIRQMPNLADLSEQQRDILSFSLHNSVEVDKEVIEYSAKNSKLDERKDFELFLQNISENDRLIISSFDVISDKVEEIVKVINCILRHRASLCVCNPARIINLQTNIADVFPLLNDVGEAQRGKTTQIGRPKGSRSSSKFDVYYSQIINMLKESMSVSAIARELGVSRSSLKDYIESRRMKELVKGAWMKVSGSVNSTDNVLLICPFEQK